MAAEEIIWQVTVDGRPFHRNWRGPDARARSSSWLISALRSPAWHEFTLTSVTAGIRIDLDRGAGSAAVRQAWGGSIEKVTEAWAAGEIAEATFLAVVEEWGWPAEGTRSAEAQDTIDEPGRKNNAQA